MSGVRGVTPSQTVGPYFTMRLSGEGDNNLFLPGTPGQPIRIEGQVQDGDRTPIEDALVELWQADAAGRYNGDSDFFGFGRSATDFATGGYCFHTIKPGRVPLGDDHFQAPHLTLIIQARGMLKATYTRVYFDDEVAANALDPVLASVPAHRRSTLIAIGVGSTYRFDIRYQGDDETVFFDL